MTQSDDDVDEGELLGGDDVARCPQCQSELPSDSPAGLCAKCLLDLGFEYSGDQTTSTSYRPPFIAPTPEHLAPFFPQLEIQQRIGQGGMGVVYRARQKQLDRLVALKILRPDLIDDPSFAERFQREARLLAQLQHPNIVGIYDFGQTDQLFFLIMEFVDGANLRQIELADEVTPSLALALVPQICAALQYAHSGGVVHRDIKPENILVNTEGVVKIADFGLAKMGGRVEETSLTRQGQVMGTPHYMAPEQIEKPGDVDHRADIYSLGVVLYEMLTGELPLGRFAAPSARASVAVGIDEVVLRALEKQPELRYQHVTEVQTDIEQIDATSHTSKLEKNRFELPAGSHLRRVRGDWSGELSGENGLLLATDCLWWCSIGDAICVVAMLLMSLENDDFLFPAFCAFGFALIGNVTSHLLRYREYGPLAIGGAALCLLPLPCLGFRFVAAIWALVCLVRAKLAFSSPTIGDSRVIGGYKTTLKRFGSGLLDSMVGIGKLAARGGRAFRLGLSRLRSSVLLQSLCLAGIWSLLCLLAWGALQIGWLPVFAPKRVSINDLTATKVYSPLKLESLGVVGRAWREIPSPAIRRSKHFDHIEIQATLSNRRGGTHRLYYYPATNTVRDDFSRNPTPYTIETSVANWFNQLAQQFDTDISADDQAITDSVYSELDSVLQYCRWEYENRNNLPDPVRFGSYDVSPTIADLLDSPLLDIRSSNARRSGRTAMFYASDFAHVMIAGLALLVWCSGMLAVVPATIAAYRHPDQRRALYGRTLGVGLSLMLAAACGVIALIAYLSAAWLQTHDNLLGIDLSSYYWFQHHEVVSQLAGCLFALCAIALVLLGCAAALWMRSTWLRVWPLAIVIMVLPLLATVFLLVHAPHLHYWPLLVPCWLAAATAPLLWALDRRRQSSSELPVVT